MAQRLERLPPMQETWVRSLGREDPLEKEMATHSSTLAWRIPWMEEPGRLQSTGSQRVGHNPVCKTAKETQMYRTVFWTLWERARVGWFGKIALKHVIIICETNHQSRFDAWYRVLRAGALGWPRGMGWGGRWVGCSGWGTHVHPWRIHVHVWQNHYNIVISLQLK